VAGALPQALAGAGLVVRETLHPRREAVCGALLGEAAGREEGLLAEAASVVEQAFAIAGMCLVGEEYNIVVNDIYLPCLDFPNILINFKSKYLI
jgi:hypothetical protein